MMLVDSVTFEKKNDGPSSLYVLDNMRGDDSPYPYYFYSTPCIT